MSHIKDFALALIVVILVIYVICSYSTQPCQAEHLASTWKLDPSLGNLKVNAMSKTDHTNSGKKIGIPNSMLSIRRVLSDDVTNFAESDDTSKDDRAEEKDSFAQMHMKKKKKFQQKHDKFTSAINTRRLTVNSFPKKKY